MFKRGWELEFENGAIINESQTDWMKAPKIGITRLTLHFDGRRWDIHNKTAYLQKKRGSAVPGNPDSFRVESRSIGYYEDDHKVWYTINENTGKMDMSVEDI